MPATRFGNIAREWRRTWSADNDQAHGRFSRCWGIEAVRDLGSQSNPETLSRKLNTCAEVSRAVYEVFFQSHLFILSLVLSFSLSFFLLFFIP